MQGKLLSKLLNRIVRPAPRIPDAIRGDEDFQFLRKSPLLQGLSDAGQLFIFDRIVRRRYSRSEMIFRDGNPGVCMFLIRQGAVQLFIGGEERAPVALAELTEGALFGEIATATDLHRTASARAGKNDTLLFSISRFDLEDLEMNFPADALTLQRGITTSVVDSLIDTTEQLNSARGEIAALTHRLSRHERAPL